ncbi:MAG: 1-deoxy-D-xylulose-5-phosphate reductoisomerase [Candidatus Melainabacteria bacterium]|nr:1-deoxy-D-xylulose-5-phosphate reductoisomerase [Candidatus Melainabacteria bacterium]
MPSQRLVILGSTGSVGSQALEVIAQYPQYFQVEALAAGRNLERLAAQVQQFCPKRVAIEREEDWPRLKALLPVGFPLEHCLAGPEALSDLASLPSVDTVLVGLVGLVGLLPTLAALRSGKRVLTGNKETFVAAGHLVAPYRSQILPLDSEHSAIFQCLKGEAIESVHKIYLTASGGPFRQTAMEDLQRVCPEQALKHPNWVMGPKVTIDSATLMNKGLEVIEAHWLFGVPYDQIEVVVHPQSMVHSAVAFKDGSLMAQLGTADMRVPIQVALAHPHRLEGAYLGQPLSLTERAQWTFEPPDWDRFPCLALAYQAGRAGGLAPTVLNAADEVLVSAFLEGHIGFLEIPRQIEHLLQVAEATWGWKPEPELADILAVDDWTRQRLAREFQGSFSS